MDFRLRIVLVALWLWMWSASASAALQGHVESRSFLGPITGKTVTYNIYFPPAYSSSTDRYPVIYHLHGINGSQGGQQNTTVPQVFEDAAALGLIGPVIVVFPNGYGDSFWADSIDGAKPAETDVALQVIPHVDANFRTIADPRSRIIQGFSMGGFGATKFYAKFPQLFGLCIEYDGALLTWQTIITRHPTQAQTIFGNSESYFNQFSPHWWVNANRAALDRRYPVRMAVGALLTENRSFRDYLLGLHLPIEYTETGCPHQVPCLMTSEGVHSAAFIGGRLGRWNCPPDLTGDSVVDDADFVAFAAAYDVLDCSALPTNCPADLSGDGRVDDADFTVFASAYAAFECENPSLP
ncbi:MAG: hypothetical protein JNM86_06855 [Phycisphaerae bacterium]|nr:hypothetical protein [Phycisphaerae bacterium]